MSEESANNFGGHCRPAFLCRQLTIGVHEFPGVLKRSTDFVNTSWPNCIKQVCWTTLQSRAEAAIDRYYTADPHPTSAANPPAAASAVDRRDRRTEGPTD